MPILRCVGGDRAVDSDGSAQAGALLAKLRQSGYDVTHDEGLGR
ncbi:hypothetical protein ACGFIH_20565 [Micromonospora parva]